MARRWRLPRSDADTQSRHDFISGRMKAATAGFRTARRRRARHAPDLKVGIALRTIGLMPINALRHSPVGDTCGWCIWCGEHFSEDPDFFQPLHVSHLEEYRRPFVPYLALAPGWRMLLAP